jgi:phenylacetate-CoA ligase
MLKTLKFVFTNILKFFISKSKLRKEIYNELCLHDSYRLDQLRSVQQEMLIRIINHAYTHCDYYRTCFTNAGLTPMDITGINDLMKIPILTKSDVRVHFDKIVSSKKFKIVNRAYTSGTSGTPLKVVRDLHSIIYEDAAISRLFKWAGYVKGDRIAYIRGYKCDLDYYDPLSKSLYINASHLSERLEETCMLLVRYKIDYIDCVSSTAGMLSNYVISKKKQCIRLKGVITSSEMLTAQIRCKVKTAFQCDVFDYYGNTERVAMIANCRMGEYHLMLDYGAENLKHVGGSFFEVVSTNLFNYAMPLINYATGDVIDMDCQPSKCGMSYPVVKSIIGRESDYVMLGGKKIYSTTLTNIYSGVVDNNIQKSQFVQEQNGEIHLNLMLDDINNLRSVNLIKRNFLDWFHCEDLKVLINGEFIVHPNGKEPFVVNRMTEGAGR